MSHISEHVVFITSVLLLASTIVFKIVWCYDNCLFAPCSPLFEDGNSKILAIQCDSGHLNGDLIACARHRIEDIRVNVKKDHYRVHVLLIINLPCQAECSSFVGFQGYPWISVHIDDLHCDAESFTLINSSISALFDTTVDTDLRDSISDDDDSMMLDVLFQSDNESTFEEQIIDEPVHSSSRFTYSKRLHTLIQPSIATSKTTRPQRLLKIMLQLFDQVGKNPNVDIGQNIHNRNIFFNCRG